MKNKTKKTEEKSTLSESVPEHKEVSKHDTDTMYDAAVMFKEAFEREVGDQWCWSEADEYDLAIYLAIKRKLN